ncbi:DUF6097 family protein [Burkholderia stagnalis]
MSFLHNFGSAIIMTQFFQRQLAALHAMIDRRQIPVPKIDHFYHQAISLERLISDGSFERRYRSYSLARIALVSIATVIIVPALGLFLLSKIPSFGEKIRVATGSLMSDFMTFAYVAGIGAGVILLLVTGLLLYARMQMNYLNGPGIHRLWLSAVDRWLPELGRDVPLRLRSPNEIAELVVRNFTK